MEAGRLTHGTGPGPKTPLHSLSLPKILSDLEHSLLESSVKCTLCCWVWKLTEHPSGGDYRVSRDQASFRTSRDWAFLAIINTNVLSKVTKGPCYANLRA